MESVRTRVRGAATGLLALVVSVAAAQAPDPGVVARANAFRAADGGRLWGARLDTIPWAFVAGQRMYLTADPHQTGYVRDSGGFWQGPLPPGVTAANTSVDWAGRRWAMVLLPLPDDSLDAARLLIHETWHVVQPHVLPLPRYDQAAAGSDLLDAPEGRLWLRLEWRALADALESSGARERDAVRRALVFRSRRYALALPTERERERLLDLSEGLAEYTGWRLAGSDARLLATRLRTEAPGRRSYVRSFQYYTGPAYGLLLDRRRPGWLARLRDTLDLQVLLAGTVPGAVAADSASAETAGHAYGIDSLRAAESARWVAQQQRLDSLRALLVDGPTLRLHPKSMQFAMDPGRQVSLGVAGTVLGGFQWKGDNGAVLDAPDGVLVINWQEIRVPLDTVLVQEGVLTQPTTWTGKGWRLTLPAGWTLAPAGKSWDATPP